MSSNVVTVVFTARAQVAAQLQHLRRGALFIPLPDPEPQPFAELQLVLHLPHGLESSARGQVVQIATGVGMAVACNEPEALADALSELLAQLPEAEPGDEQAIETVWGELVRDDVSSETLDDEASGDEESSTYSDQIRALSSAEKMKLALTGDRPARMILLKDPNKNLHTQIIRNKGITLDEVRYIAGYRQTNPEALKQIGENRDWIQNPRILSALITNPKTPATMAHKLLSKLPMSELRRLAKSPNVPPAVSAAARRLVIG